MYSYYVNGGNRLSGSVNVQGSKNSVLPILAASYLVCGKSVIHNCPELSDVDVTIRILKHLGCSVKRENTTLYIDSTDASGFSVPDELMRELRSSVIFLGAVLGRNKKAVISSPGGCEIGLRPIDLHIFAMEKLGTETEEEHGRIFCKAENGLTGNTVTLSFPSVGATENALLASCTAKGTTTLINAAREPEIVDLCNFLNSCGAKIRGGGESVIVIDGVKKLNGTEHTVICDRIVAATYLAAGAVTNGDITVKNTIPAHLNAVLPVFSETGCTVDIKNDEIRLKAPKRLNRINKVVTQPFPGFPTDAQSQICAMAAVADGTSVIVENIFESRFKHIPELIRMGASVRTECKVAVIDGVKRLHGADVISPDLRGGAALVIAGLCACGKTVVGDIYHIERGYSDFCENLRSLNADIRKVKINEKIRFCEKTEEAE